MRDRVAELKRVSQASPSGAPQRSSAPSPGLGNQDLQRLHRSFEPSGGRALAPDVRARFEQRLGQDLGDVRISDGGLDAQRARGLGTRAFTVGRSIAFADGHYAPHTGEGEQLLAHELAHVAQYTGAAPSTAISRPGDAAEVEASSVAAGRPVGPRSHATAAIHCDDKFLGICVNTELPLAERLRMYGLARKRFAADPKNYFTSAELNDPFISQSIAYAEPLLPLEDGSKRPDQMPGARALTPEEVEQSRANARAEAEEWRREHHPNSYDAMRSDMEIVGHAADPSGMGIVKAPAAVAYMLAGDDYATAQQKAAMVDGFASVAAAFSPHAPAVGGEAIDFRPMEWGSPVETPMELTIGGRVWKVTEAPPTMAASVADSGGSFMSVDVPLDLPTNVDLVKYSDADLYAILKTPSQQPRITPPLLPEASMEVPPMLAREPEGPSVYTPDQLTARAKEIHADIIRLLDLDPNKSADFTVSLTQPAGGETGPIVNVTNLDYYQAMADGRVALKEGEILGSPIFTKSGKAQYHAEIMGMWDAQLFGASGGTTTSSIFACGRCGSGMGQGDFSGWTHVNLNPAHDFAATPPGFFEEWTKPTRDQVIAELIRRARAKKPKK